MIFLPYHSFTIETTCSENQVQEKLQHLVDTEVDKFNLRRYDGQIYEKEFKIWPGPSFRKPDMVLIGWLERNNGKTIIRIKIRPHWLLILFFLFFNLIIIGMFIKGIKEYTADLWASIILIIFVWLFFPFYSKQRVTELKKIVTQLFNESDTSRCELDPK